MQLYEAGVTKVTTAAAGGIVTLVPPATARPDIREIGIFVGSAVASTIGIGRPGNSPAATTTVLGQALDPADPAATCSIGTAWSVTAPTVPAVPLRRLDLPGSVGAGVVFAWGANEFPVANPAGLVIWQYSALAVTYDIYIKWEE